ncbi:MAG: ribonuclease P protein subunit [Thaumarchaeota archaeon]|nr:ribonuclease P protein subunit [Nitrososphaerota archaeon]
MRLAFGEDVTVLQSTDPSIKGLRGRFVSESMKIIQLERGGRLISVPKSGSAILLEGSGEVLLCDEMVGRLEERLARGSRY